MTVTIAAGAAAAGFAEMLRDTADTFGWKWELFLSQVISFCIVAVLLRQFAYKPILAVLEDRRRKIEEGMLNAEKIRKDSPKQRSATRKLWQRRTLMRKE